MSPCLVPRLQVDKDFSEVVRGSVNSGFHVPSGSPVRILHRRREGLPNRLTHIILD